MSYKNNSIPKKIFICIIFIGILNIFITSSYAQAGMRGLKHHNSWVSFIMDVPGQVSWVRINTATNGANFAFDFGQAGTIPLLALPFSSPAMQLFISQYGVPPASRPVALQGSARVDLNPIIPVRYSCTFENGTAWMIIVGMPPAVINQCVSGKTLRLKVSVAGMDYFYNFPLIGFTSALKHAAYLYKSIYGSVVPDSSYFN